MITESVRFGVMRRLDAALERRGLTRLCPRGVARQTGPLQSGVKPPHSKHVFAAFPLVVLCACTAISGETAYSHACWLNGLRKTKTDTSPTLFAIETSRYGFCLDLADFGKAGFGPRPEKAPGYAESLEVATDWLRELSPAALVFEIELDGKRYRASQSRAGVGNGKERFRYVRMWESGRFVQHYDFLELELRDHGGTVLPCQASLDLVAWPDSLTLTARISPGAGNAVSNTPVWKNAKCRVGVKGTGIDCISEKTIEGDWCGGVPRELTVTHAALKSILFENVSITLTCGGTQCFPAVFEAGKHCEVSRVSKLLRTFRRGSTDIREYDDFTVAVENKGDGEVTIPFLLELRDVANITGLCPVLCDKAGRPTGIPVQLSKNWHHGAYLMAYALIPAKPGKTDYLLRIAYGFYGSLPSASHAQLSLVGYGGNGRWDQLAIGCWGETFCFDMDMTCVPVAITDVRALMIRDGINGKKWNWTDAGWGGDWLGILDAAGNTLPFSGMRTAYLAHGPCMSEVRHAGFYGAGREVALEARVRTIRSDDYARTFQKLRYTFNTPAAAEGVWFFKMGKTDYYVAPEVAFGNGKGLIAAQPVSVSLKPKEFVVAPRELGGKAPWWVAFPGAKSMDGREWGTGYRALVIRSYSARFGGKIYSAPTISMPVSHVLKEGPGAGVDLMLVAPPGVKAFRRGDTLEMDLEWITVPRVADDYYGPNETFRKHLVENPSSWRTTCREARGNDLSLKVSGGTLLERYPIVIKAQGREITVKVKGGVGVVPIRFEGLAAATGYSLYERTGGREHKLDQSVNGNDFWQADYDDAGGTTRMTFNLPLDNKPESTWVMRHEPR